MPPEKPRRLGRGLDALFNAPSAQAAEADGSLRQIPLSQISSNPFQPRKQFAAVELRELQESLEANGLLQPVSVRPSPAGGGYELIAGERRFRAAANLGWAHIPAVVRDLTDRDMLALALVENLQRADLNPIEEAEGYDRLIRDFGHTQQSVAAMVGRERSTIANTLRILQLPPDVRSLLETGKLTAGQARPLLSIGDPNAALALANQIVQQGMSAREVERRVRDMESARKKPGARVAQPSKSADVSHLEQQLRRHLQTDVSITLKGGNRGTVSIEFYSADDLERVLDLMGCIRSPQ